MQLPAGYQPSGLRNYDISNLSVGFLTCLNTIFTYKENRSPGKPWCEVDEENDVEDIRKVQYSYFLSADGGIIKKFNNSWFQFS